MIFQNWNYYQFIVYVFVCSRLCIYRCVLTWSGFMYYWSITNYDIICVTAFIVMKCIGEMALCHRLDCMRIMYDGNTFMRGHLPFSGTIICIAVWSLAHFEWSWLASTWNDFYLSINMRKLLLFIVIERTHWYVSIC